MYCSEHDVKHELREAISGFTNPFSFINPFSFSVKDSEVYYLPSIVPAKPDIAKDLLEAQDHTGKCIHRFGGIYAYCRYFIDRKW